MLPASHLRILVLTLLFISNTLLAKNQWIGIQNQPAGEPGLSIVNDELVNTELEFQLPGYYRSEISIEGATYQMISAPDMTPIIKAGAPDLPKYYRSIIIPDDAHMRLDYEVLEFQDIQVANLVPSKGTLTRNINPATVAFQFGPEYSENAFYPAEIAALGDPYVMRNVRGTVVQIHPFRYNPVSGILRVYTHLRIRITADGPARLGLKSKTYTSLQRAFLPVYKSHFINYTPNSVLYDLPEETGRLLVITADNYFDAVLPLIDWKQTRGLPTELIRVSDVGNNAIAIFNAVQARYNSPDGLTFLLLVGDAGDVAPAIGSSGAASGAASDPSYALLDGGNGDHYPDIFVGRLSANTVEQVATQVAKIIDYEAHPDPDGAWYGQAMGIASDQGAGQGDDGEADYVHMNNIRTDLLGYGYDPVDQIYDPTASAAQVSAGLNAGRGLVNYVGHGSTTSWGTTGFSNYNVNSLSNTGMLPVIFSVACVNGNFQSSTCFAEAWLRAGSAETPTGAVAFYGSTINQSWAPPMCAEDEYIDLLCADADMTIGALMYSGSAQMIDEYGTDGFDMYATWHIFGDPSMPIRTATPTNFTNVSAPNVLVLGSSQLNISGNFSANEVACLSSHGNLIASAPLSPFGSTSLNFSPLMTLDTCLLTLTGHNRSPWQQEILVIAPEGPYLIATGLQVADSLTGNGNGQLDFGELADLDLMIHNVGADTCAPLYTRLTIDDPFIQLLNDSLVGLPLPSDSTFVLGPFEVAVDNAVPDGHLAQLLVSMDNGQESWMSELSLTLHAPIITLEQVTVNDADNHRLDIGELAELDLELYNAGGTGLNAATITLASTDPYVSALGAPVILSHFSADALADCPFSISLQYATPPGHEIPFTWELVSEEGYNANGSFTLPAGLVVEDFESGDFEQFDWIFGGHQDWQIDSLEVFEGVYAARSGAIGNYQNSELSLVIDVTEDAVLSFQHKVSSQTGADGLEFILDGLVADSWQGELPWSESSYALTAGSHELVWKYSKNSSGSSGSDCAWIDFVVLPLSNIPGTIIGDVTADTQINVQDIVRLVNIILGSGAAPQPAELYCGDINGDTVVDIGDLVLLVNIIMGDQLGRAAPVVASLELSRTGQQLSLTSNTPIRAVDLRYRGILTPALFHYQQAHLAAQGTQHLIAYSLNPGALDQTITLGTVTAGFELLNLTAAFPDGQVIAVDLQALNPPERFQVYPSFPNPFNPQTTLSYDLSVAGLTQIAIFDIQGRIIATLMNSSQPAGHYSLTWAGTDAAGRSVSAGLYFCHINQGSHTAVQKLLLLK